MIALNDIRKAVIRRIDEKTGYRVTGERVAQADFEKGPIVQVNFLPVTSRMAGAGTQVQRGIMIDCVFMQSTVTSNTALYEALDALYLAVTPYIPVEGRNLTPEGIRTVLLDGAAHLMFELDFNDAIETTNDYPDMGSLNLKEDIN